MASENKKALGPAATPNGQPPTMQEYKKEQARLREMIEKQKQLSQRLVRPPPSPSPFPLRLPSASFPRRLTTFATQAQLEDSISQKESAYLDSTPHGNIITGYDGYIKGGGSAAHKKKPPPLEQNRVFTRSSISYRPNASGVRPLLLPPGISPIPYHIPSLRRPP